MRAQITRWMLLVALLVAPAFLTGAAPGGAPVAPAARAAHAPAASIVPDSVGWQDELVDGQGEVGFSPAMVLDSLGRPRLAYYDLTDESVKYAAWDGVAWQTDTIESGLGDVQGDQTPDRFILTTSLAVYGGTAYVVYEKHDNQSGVNYLRLAVGGPGGWSLSTVTINTISTFAYAPALRLDSQHNLQLTYTLRDLYDSATAQQIIYGRLLANTPQWQLQAVDACACWDSAASVTSSLASIVTMTLTSPRVACNRASPRRQSGIPG